MLMLRMMLFCMNFLVFLEILGALESFPADLKIR
jgi:hypothetical protein